MASRMTRDYHKRFDPANLPWAVPLPSKARSEDIQDTIKGNVQRPRWHSCKNTFPTPAPGFHSHQLPLHVWP